MLSKPLGIANYLKPLVLNKDRRKIDVLSIECLINNIMHLVAQVSFHPSLLPLYLLNTAFDNFEFCLYWIKKHLGLRRIKLLLNEINLMSASWL